MYSSARRGANLAANLAKVALALVPLLVAGVGCGGTMVNDDAPTPLEREVSGFAASGIIGHIDGFRKQYHSRGGFVKGSTWMLEGWACDVGVERSVAVHAYISEQGQYKLIAHGVADRGNEKAVNGACRTYRTSHRFVIPFHFDQLALRKHRPVYVHGISTTGGPNLTIGGSGAVTLPDLGLIKL